MAVSLIFLQRVSSLLIRKALLFRFMMLCTKLCSFKKKGNYAQHPEFKSEIEVGDSAPSHPHLFCLSVCPILSPYELKVQIRQNKLDQTKININGFDRAKSAAQVLYGPLLIFRTQQRKTANSNAINKHGSIKELSLCMWTAAA